MQECVVAAIQKVVSSVALTVAGAVFVQIVI